MLIAGDVYRPAAIDQLVILGEKVIVIILYSLNKCFFFFSDTVFVSQVGVPVYTAGTEAKPSDIAKQGLKEAKLNNVDVVIMDTAGRLQVITFLSF